MTRATGELATMCRCGHEKIAHPASYRGRHCLAYRCPCSEFSEKRRSKYNAERTTVDGVTYDSAAEARRASELAGEQRAGVIRNLRRQVTIPLVVNGLRVGTYRADFSYERASTGEVVFEDVKGVRTPVYVLKRKLVQACTGIKILEVEAR